MGHVLVIDFVNWSMSMLYKAKANGPLRIRDFGFLVESRNWEVPATAELDFCCLFPHTRQKSKLNSSSLHPKALWQHPSIDLSCK
ncbi:unnamed protein product [Camellia sinensis]